MPAGIEHGLERADNTEGVFPHARVITMRVIERRSADHVFTFVENDVMVAAQVVPPGTYVDREGRPVVVKGWPMDHPTNQQKVLYETDKGELHVCSLHYFNTRFHLENRE